MTFDLAISQGTGASSLRYQGITLTVDGLNWVQIWHSQEAGGCQTMIELGATGSSVSWSQELEKRCCKENQLPERAGPSGPPVEQPAEWERSAAKDRGTWGQYVAVCSISNSPFATLLQPFRIKCERYIFLKKCVRSSLLLILLPHVHVYDFKCITAMQQKNSSGTI